MASEPRAKRPLYFDQQAPLDEPVESGRSRITQETFARRSPTAEDDYFRLEDERKLHPRESEGPSTPPKQAQEPETLFERLFRAITRRFNSGWRP